MVTPDGATTPASSEAADPDRWSRDPPPPKPSKDRTSHQEGQEDHENGGYRSDPETEENESQEDHLGQNEQDGQADEAQDRRLDREGAASDGPRADDGWRRRGCLSGRKGLRGGSHLPCLLSCRRVWHIYSCL